MATIQSGNLLRGYPWLAPSGPTARLADPHPPTIVNELADSHMLIECKHCKAMVDAEEIGFYEYEDHPNGPPGRYTFLKCVVCKQPLVALQEDYGEGLDHPVRVLPELFRVSDKLPDGVRIAYAEAVACVSAKAFTAAAIMCRKTLEGACKEVGTADKSLNLSLKRMKDNGTIDGRLAEWADALRIAGNEAAHDIGVRILPEDAHDLVDFTGAFLDNVFLLRDRFDRFMARRSGSSASKP